MLDLTHRTIKGTPRRQQATGSHREHLCGKVPLIEAARILAEHQQHRVDVRLGVLREPTGLEKANRVATRAHAG